MEESRPEDWEKANVVVFHTEILRLKMAGHTLYGCKSSLQGGKDAFKVAYRSELKINSLDSETSKISVYCLRFYFGGI